jgi:bifunctional non-homologous end joining protein LigD
MFPSCAAPRRNKVWTFAKKLARELAGQHAKLITAEYRIAKRPSKRVLVDYNQNAWGRTLASVYSVRPTPHATVSTPLKWQEVERGVEMEDFCIDNVPQRIRRLGDLWKPLLAKSGPLRLERFL